ncbi:MFS transporter [Microbacterium sp. No. 7]|uniref:MFS transporter n=1 Tax=Microbacterium sp. No. 7 TaxID=1714373 RepID=UPI0006D2821A|nr:MFS transporter [Microbacterium sp. No. 7]ALJ22135.1 ABC transporter permease [Microbacterium sp. No. 7]
MRTVASRPVWRGRVLALVGIVLVAFSLRSAVAALSPVVAYVQQDFAVPAWMMGLIGTVPPVCFAVVGILTPALVRRFGLEQLATVVMLVIAGAIALRAFAPNGAVLLIGTVLIFVAAGAGNVVTPPLVKAYFPDRIGAMTSVYSAMLAVAAFVPPLVAVPVADAAGWRVSLGMWCVFALMAAVPWLALARRRHSEVVEAGSPPPAVLRRLLRLPLAWALTVIFAASAATAYAAFAWLPQILVDTAGIPAAEAGALLALFGAIAFPLALMVPVVVVRWRRPAIVYVVSALTGFAGVAGLVFAPAAAPWLWVTLFAIPQALFSLVLVLMQLRARTPEGIVGLSGFAQSVGYGIAAFVPLLFGLLHEATGDWAPPLFLYAALLACAVPAGILVSRRDTVEDAWERRHGAW